MTRRPRKPSMRFRWLAPDGRKGRWRITRQGAETSAVNTRYLSPGDDLRVSVCSRSAGALWPSLERDGWTIEVERKPK